MSQDLTFFALAVSLAVLLTLAIGLCSAAQHMDAGGQQLGEASGLQFSSNSPIQTASASESQSSGSFGAQTGGNFVSQEDSGSESQIGGSHGAQANGNSGSQAKDGFGPQTSGNTGSRGESPSASQIEVRSRSQMGVTSSTSLNASGGKDAQAESNRLGRGDVDVQNWRGTASKNGDSYSIRLNVERITTLDPDAARNLLSSNLSLEDIRSQLGSGKKDNILRGSLRIGNDIYRLVNITMVSSTNNTTLSARLAGPSTISGSGDQAGIVGHMSVVISADDSDIARGYASIDDSRYSGTYSIELERVSGRGYMWGILDRESQ